MEQEQKQESQPQLCNGCHSFYATATTNYLCSKCFKETQGSSNQGNSSAVKEGRPSLVGSVETSTSITNKVEVSVGSASTETEIQTQPKEEVKLEEVKEQQPSEPVKEVQVSLR